MSFSALFKIVNKKLNEPHEKFVANVIMVFVFTSIYYFTYVMDEKTFFIHPDIKRTSVQEPLDIVEFFQFATLTQFGITFGDIVPKSLLARCLVILHAFLFWFIMLN